MVSPRTLSVTFLYDHIGGFYIGVLPNGVEFKFIAPPESNLPQKLVNALRGLQNETVRDHEGAVKKPLMEVDLSALDQKIVDFEKRHGARKLPTRGAPRKAKPAREKISLSLEDLDLA
jgi:hypothetical protein